MSPQAQRAREAVRDLAEGQTARVIMMDADLAREWLDRAKADPTFRQRNVKPRRVERYAKKMLEGRWVLNGETAILDQDSIPIDCQHRLHAIILATEMAKAKALPPPTFKTWIVENVDRDAFLSMGDSAPRKLADALHIGGRNVVDGEEVSEKHFATALKWLNAYNSGTISLNEGLDPQIGFEILEANENLVRHVQWALEKPRFQGIQPSILSVCRYLCFQTDPEKAALFFSNFKHEDGHVFRKADPGAILATALGAEAKLKRSSRFDYVRFARVIKAWNYFMAGVEASAITFKRKGSKRAEQFPVVYNRMQAVQHARSRNLYKKMGGKDPKDVPSGSSPIAALEAGRKVEAALGAAGYRTIDALLDHGRYLNLPPALQADVVERLKALGFIRPGGRQDPDEGDDE
jgi:hypothetical protein